jgi:hypothetical protein
MARKTRKQKINTAQRRISKKFPSFTQDTVQSIHSLNKQDELDSWFNEQIPYIKKDLAKSILLSLVAITFEILLWRFI